MIKKCLWCNIEFKTYAKKQKFCSLLCRGLNQRKEKIKIKCASENCQNEIEVFKNSKRQQKLCSVACQIEWQKKIQFGENNGNFGRKNSWGTHNEEVRQKIKEKILNSWQKKERLEKHYKARRDGKYPPMPEKTREKLSIMWAERLSNYPQFGAFATCKRGWRVSEKTNENEYFHSSWEEMKMQELDSDKNVKFWTKKHKFIIPYRFENVTKNYVPDFFIISESGKKIIIEVKGYIENEKKFKAKVLAAYIFFSSIKIEYQIDFMKNEQKYLHLIEWYKDILLLGDK